MLHIIGIILKIIGILLLILLGLLLVLVLLVLLVPIRYRAAIQKYPDIKGRGCVSWLLHLIHVSAYYEEDGFWYKVRILGIPVFNSRKPKKCRQPEVPVYEKAVPVPEPEKKTERMPAGTDEAERMPEDVGNPVSELPQPVREADTAGEREPERKSLWQRIKEFFRGILDKIRSIKKKFRQIKRQAVRIKEFLQEEDTKESLRLLFGSAKGMFKHILPRKVKGWIRFGTGDPCRTGQILGLLGMGISLLPKDLTIRPDFTEAVLEGNVKLSGRIVPVIFLITGLKLLLKKEVRRTIMRGRKLAA
ncbi:DUF2953 domain-containing protein [Anaerolentibacter hominis]|uniref:DUF2953 domain-containing protein n=1 Tax=Anaerolentibacter hominis TaxID=3079009 RepID=UPI0031B8A635